MEEIATNKKSCVFNLFEKPVCYLIDVYSGEISLQDICDELNNNRDTYGDQTKLISKIENIRSLIKEGDLIDFGGVYASGLCYYDGCFLIRTCGSHGIFLPHKAWKFAKEYGLNYYSDTNVDYIIIPKECQILPDTKKYNKGISMLVKNNGQYALSIKRKYDHNDHVYVDGYKHSTTLIEVY